jgi:uncharacterized integral membrane protein
MRRGDEDPGPEGAVGPGGTEPEGPARDELEAIDRERRRRVRALLVAAGILVLLAVFVLRNSQRVPVDFVFFRREARLIWVMATCALLGGVVGYLAGRPPRRLRRRGS